MKMSKYNMQIGIMASFTKRIMESTNGLYQRDVKGAKKYCLFLEVGYPQIIRQNL